jgi:hypothetical protein
VNVTRQEISSDELVREVQEQRELLAANQKQLIEFLSDMPLNMQKALGPEITSISEAIEGLSGKMEDVAQGLKRKKKSSRKRETQSLEPKEEVPKEAVPKEAEVVIHEPAEEKPWYRRDVRSLFRGKK